MNYVAISVAIALIVLFNFFDYCDRQQSKQIIDHYEEEADDDEEEEEDEPLININNTASDPVDSDSNK